VNHLNFGPAWRQTLEHVAAERGHPDVGDPDAAADEQVRDVELVAAGGEVLAAPGVRIFGQELGEHGHLGLLVAVAGIEDDFSVTQGCQILLGRTYQNGKNTNNHKIYQIVTNYTKWQ
jgi:hypothetical protein